MSRTTATAAATRTASLYIRLSREAAAENLSRDGMEADCRRVAAEHGLDVHAVHVDDGISGAVRNRPAFLAWLADGQEGRAGTLIAWHADRMTREGVNVAAMILDVVEGKDAETGKVTRPPVRLLDAKGMDSQGDEMAFRFRFVIAAEVARGERARMADRTRAAKGRAMAAGRWIGGHPPFGFRVVAHPSGAGKVLEQEPAEAAFVREATARVLAGETLASVVRWANGPHGHAPRRAEAWARATLRQTLTGHPVAGKVVRRVNGDRDRVVPVLDADGSPVTLPAILNPDESAAVRQALAPKRDDRKRGGRQPARLLSALARCGSCGGVLYVARPAGRPDNYRCTIGKEQGLCAKPVQVTADGLDAYVADAFLASHGDRPTFVRRATVTGAAAVEAAETAHATALAALAASPTAEALAVLQAATVERDASLAAPSESVVLLVPTGRTVREDWEAGTVLDRRDLIAANYADVIVRPIGTRGGRQVLDGSRVGLVAQPPFSLARPAEDHSLRLVVATDAVSTVQDAA